MDNINLFKPVILQHSLDDMAEAQKETAIDLLRMRKLLVPEATGLTLIKNKVGSNLPDFFLYGSEAVCYYRQSLGLPDVSVKSINVDDILCCCDDFDTLYDIQYFLRSVYRRNLRNQRLQALRAPAIILMNEYRLFQEYVESLQNNNYCGKPKTARYNIAEANEEPVYKEEALKSLVDIEYNLITG